MGGRDSLLDEGLDQLRRHHWREADRTLSQLDVEAGALPAPVLEQLAVARVLIGRQEPGEECWARAHESFLRDGDPPGAARCAFWLGLQLVLRGEPARGGGWLGRAHEALAGHDECAVHGLLLIPAALRAMGEGDADLAEDTFRRARELGVRLAAPEVVDLADLGLGQSLLRRGARAEGLAILDRVMAGREFDGQADPLLRGITYCAVIEECQRIFDVARAREWTTALDRWLRTDPDVVAFRGHCMVYRAEVVQRHGDWPAAVDESRRARDRLSTPPGHPATGLALYRLGELHRLRGEFDEAEAAFEESNRWGHAPQPGRALLRWYQGDLDAATATIHRLLEETPTPAYRCDLLVAAVRILLAAGDLAGARRATSELDDLATAFDAPFLRALADQARGMLALAEGRPDVAVAPLQASLAAWLTFQAPYEEGLTRAALAAAYRALGDHDAAQLEVATARTLLDALGAVPDVATLDAAPTEQARRRGAPAPRSLSLRELQVLRLLATGATNREIADALYVSVRTVDRHASNLYSKLGVSTRAAATSYAYEHQLL